MATKAGAMIKTLPVNNHVFTQFPDAVAAVVVCAIFPALSALAVGLRILAQRGLKGRSLGTDDYLIIAGLVFATANCMQGIWSAVRGGMGWPLEAVAKYGLISTFSKVIYAGQILWCINLTFVRVSLLLFYRRIFVTRFFRIADLIMIILSILWFIAVLFATIFSFSYNRTAQSDINYPAFLIATAALDMSLDIGTLMLPLFVIKNLQMSRRAKITVSGIFGLGLFCVITSVVRLVYFVRLSHIQERDRQLSNTTFYCFIWSIIEPNTSIIAACLPTMAPLLTDSRRIRLFFTETFSRRKLIGSSGKMSRQTDNGGEIRSKEWQQLPVDKRFDGRETFPTHELSSISGNRTVITGQ